MEKYRKIVEKYFGLDISAKTRKFEYVFARACYYYLCREFGGFSFSKIAKTMNKNHATVMHSLKELPYMVKHDEISLKKYNKLISKFNPSMCVKTEKMGIQRLVRDYNLLLLENDQLKLKIKELEETIYLLADLE
jgi:hypothetical protein|tara:strand:+ start:2066 stop:2470 length:405 start_codon:yes stop_codon:yes gene_type:complete